MGKQASHTGHLREGVFADTPIDRDTIPQHILDIAKKTRSAPLPWQGQFSPQFVEALLSSYSGARSVMDPFAGSGTLLYEASVAGMHAVGIEVNPAAYLLAKFYTLTSLSPQQRADALREVSEVLVAAGVHQCEFFGRPNPDPKWLGRVVSAWKDAQPNSALQIFLGTLIVLVDAHPDDLPSPDRAASPLAKLSRLLAAMPEIPDGSIDIRLGDARETRQLASSIDLVVTSPPYINVYNYHQKYRRAVEALGWRALHSAQSEIGANRKHRGNRVLTVTQYCLDMVASLREVRRVLLAEGTAVFVVGRESMVRKTTFYNGEIIAELAVRASGLNLLSRQERVFVNRFGKPIYEDILHFSPGSGRSLPTLKGAQEEARGVAEVVLRHALTTCPRESREDVLAAIDSIHKVASSPPFE